MCHMPFLLDYVIATTNTVVSIENIDESLRRPRARCHFRTAPPALLPMQADSELIRGDDICAFQVVVERCAAEMRANGSDLTRAAAHRATWSLHGPQIADCDAGPPCRFG